MGSQLSLDFSVATFSGYDDDGFLSVQDDAMGLDGKAGTVAAEAMSPGGLLHRPLDPDKDTQGTPTGGANLLRIQNGDHRHVMPLGDPRIAKLLPKVRKGGTALHGGSKTLQSFVVIEGVDPDGVDNAGSVSAAAAYKAKDGTKKAHFLGMLVRKSGEEALAFAHGEGHGLIATASGKRYAGIKNAAGNASVGVNDDGAVIVGKTKLLGSLTVGEQTAAQELVLAKPLFQYLAALEAKLAASVVGPPAILISQVMAGMKTRLLKGM